MKLSGLPRPRRPPAPEPGIGIGERDVDGGETVAEPRPRLLVPTVLPRRACSRLSPVRALLDCVLLVWATEGILSRHPGSTAGAAALGAAGFYHVVRSRRPVQSASPHRFDLRLSIPLCGSHKRLRV